MVWLHPVNKNKEKDFEKFSDAWQNDCEDFHIILVCPKADSERGWTQSEGEFVQEAVKAVGEDYTIDRQRIIVHGMDRGGEMAFWMGFRLRGCSAAWPRRDSPDQQSARDRQSAAQLLPGRRR